MQIKLFQSISKILSILFKLIAVLFLVMLVFGSLNLFFRENFSSYSFDPNDTFSIVFADKSIVEEDYEWALSIMIPIALAALSYIFFKASYLFDYLAEGLLPFTYQFSKSVKIMGLLLIGYDLINPLLYTIFVNWAAEEGRYVYLSISSFFFIGLILYFASEYINYGITLQEVEEEPIKIKAKEK